jgi:hypothetical protein
MTGSFFQDHTLTWHCDHCDARNVTTERDTFSDQCRNCTLYNEVDWSDRDPISVSEARAAAATADAE